MSKLHEAARQALDALWTSANPKAEAAIAALREALATQEPEQVCSNHLAFKLGYAKGVDDEKRRAKARGPGTSA